MNYPDPEVWPVCPATGTPYVLRRGLSISRGWIWTWAHDCTTQSGTRRRSCAGEHPVLHNADGPLPAQPVNP